MNCWSKATFRYGVAVVLALVNSHFCSGQYFYDSLIVNDVPTFEEAHKWQRNDADRYTEDTTYAKFVPSVDMETIQDRASCLDLDMPLVINKTVCGFIHFFTVRKRNYTQTMLERKNYYFPIFEYYLKKHEMPDALKYLSIVESGLNFKARSRTGAVGLWQFMPGTGSDFYLAQNQHIDERQNPYLATEAACKFLKYLHRLYGDWELALAAYNCGPGNVNKAIRKSGKKGFWEIYDFLPKETRSYVPQFHAVVYSMNFAAEHNIHPDIDSMLVTTAMDTFRIAKSFDIEKLEVMLGLPENTLHHANPTLRTKVYPAFSIHPLLVPTSHSYILASNFDKFIDSASVVLVENIENESVKSRKCIVYSGRKGEKLQLIANKYDVSLASVKRWNHLSSSKLNRSQNIRIYVNKVPVEPVEEATASLAAVSKSSEVKGITTVENPDYHIVRKGEKLYQVAIQHGLTTSEIKRANQLTSSHINAGQRLLINLKSVEKEEKIESVASNPEKENSSIPAEYIVKKGDRLFAIAKAHGLSVDQIRTFNHLKSDQLKAGQLLSLRSFEAIAKTTQDSTYGGDASLEKDGNVGVASKIKHHKGKKIEKIELPKTYLVQKGDTLYSITKKFAKLTVKDLIRINNLKDKKIKPGQQLIVG